MSEALTSKQSKNHVLVTGASSIIGQPVCHELASNDFSITEISRSSMHNVVSWDMLTGKGSELIAKKVAGEKDGFNLIHCAPIWFLPQHIEWLASLGLRRMIVFSSSSIEGKRDSKSQKEQQIVDTLKTAEDGVVNACEAANINLTIFRPTMIYGHGQGQNLAFIANVIRRFKCFPVVSQAMGLRQPVHADDLAKAVVQAIDNENTFAKKYTLSGAEALPYKDIVKRIFIAMGYTPRVIEINGTLYRFALRLAKLINKSLPVDPAMVDRMQQDLNFNHDSATRDFGYKPSVFLPNGAKDLIDLSSQKRC